MRKLLTLAGALAASTLGVTTPAQAHDHLVSSQPAADATVPAPREIILKFSGKMLQKFSGFELTKPSGAKAPVKVKLSKDGRTLTGAPVSPLTPGAYKVTWHAVSTDTHRMVGSYLFTVR